MKKLLIILVSLASVYPSYSFASQEDDQPSGDLPVSADAVFIPNYFSFGTHIDEAILQKVGCKYSIPDAVTASRLMKLLGDARGMPGTPLEYERRFEVRNKIVFHFRDKDMSVEFSQEFTNQPYVTANWDNQVMRLKMDVVNESHRIVREGGFEQINKKATAPCDAL